MANKEIIKKFEDGHDKVADIIGHLPPSVGFALLMSLTEKLMDATDSIKGEDEDHYQGQLKLFAHLMMATGQKYLPETEHKTKVKTPEDICKIAAEVMECSAAEAGDFFASEVGHFQSLSKDRQIWFCPKFAFSLIMHVLGVKK